MYSTTKKSERELVVQAEREMRFPTDNLIWVMPT